MKAYLMFRNQDYIQQRHLPHQASAVQQDLEMDILFKTMAQGDEVILRSSMQAFFAGSSELEVIFYRQQILQDCLAYPNVIRELYALTGEALNGEKSFYFGMLRKYPDAVLRRGGDVMQMMVGILIRLRKIAEAEEDRFASPGFKRFFAMLRAELGDEYITQIQHYLQELKFGEGMLISAELGAGNKGSNYTLRRPKSAARQGSWLARIFSRSAPEYAYYISDRDESGARALGELKDRGINLVANALAQSSDHILRFFNMLRTEMAFYVGCLNLYEQLDRMQVPVCFPQPLPRGGRSMDCRNLYDVCLALTKQAKIVGNDIQADHKDLFIITGANQGGKSTFLRSIGLAQLMMECGLFVPAESFQTNVCDGLYTHFKREEDPTMTSGKLDEELSRMNQIVNRITPNSLVLFNESFAATNEREGAEIAGQITKALVEKNIQVFFVTHLYEFAHGFYNRNMENALFLRAERHTDGSRTFKISPGEPLQTSYGPDLYAGIFGTAN